MMRANRIRQNFCRQVFYALRFFSMKLIKHKSTTCKRMVHRPSLAFVSLFKIRLEFIFKLSEVVEQACQISSFPKGNFLYACFCIFRCSSAMIYQCLPLYGPIF